MQESNTLNLSQSESFFGKSAVDRVLVSLCRRTLVPLACLVLLPLLHASELNAQQRSVPRYQPGRATVSPYLNLLRGDAGVLPNYYSLVRPFQNQERLNQQQAARNQFQSREIQRVQREFQQSAPSPTGKAGWFGTRGNSGFQQTSHYYSRFRRPGPQR